MLCSYITFLIASGLHLATPLAVAPKLFGLVIMKDFGNIAKDDTLQKLMQEYLDIEQLQKSIPLYVAIYRQPSHFGKAFHDAIFAIKDAFSTEILGKQNKLSEFRHIQALPLQEQKETILASATLPYTQIIEIRPTQDL